MGLSRGASTRSQILTSSIGANAPQENSTWEGHPVKAVVRLPEEATSTTSTSCHGTELLLEVRAFSFTRRQTKEWDFRSSSCLARWNETQLFLEYRRMYSFPLDRCRVAIDTSIRSWGVDPTLYPVELYAVVQHMCPLLSRHDNVCMLLR